MSFAYMPLYTGDYLRDTQHLSMSEHGAFLKLLMHCWDQKGPAPLDERKLMGICNARSTDEIEAMRRVLAEFFVRMDDGFYNRRIQTEVERSEAISRARSNAGKKGYEAKAKHLPSNCLPSAEQVPLSPSPSLSLETNNTTTVRKEPVARKPRAKKPETTLAEYLGALPKDAPAIAEDDAIFEWARKAGIPADWIAVAWSAFKAAMLGKDKRQADWPATFRNYVRLDYLRLWRQTREGEWFLTPAGEAERRAMHADHREAA